MSPQIFLSVSCTSRTTSAWTLSGTPPTPKSFRLIGCDTLTVTLSAVLAVTSNLVGTFFSTPWMLNVASAV